MATRFSVLAFSILPWTEAPGGLQTTRSQSWTQLSTEHRDFPGGAVDMNVPAKAGDTGWIPALGRSHKQWSN